MKLLVKKIYDDAVVPTRGSAHAVGYDIYAYMPHKRELIIQAHQVWIIDTGISVAIPAGHYGRIAPRSGLAAKHAIDVLAGVVDPDYRGEIKVILQRVAAWGATTIRHGDRIAQLILEKVSTPDVEIVDDLETTARGERGFGSTGY